MYTKPKLIISSLDAERLESLIDSLPGKSFPGKDELEHELARAEIVDPEDVPPTVVTMNSTVRFEIRIFVRGVLSDACLSQGY
jgi:regulator of nucleoside diphosphate kinase